MGKFGGFFKNIEENIMVVLLPFTCVLVAASTFGRYSGLFNMYWAEELIRYLYIWVAFLGISMGVKSDAHFKLQLFVKMLPEPFKTIISIIGLLITVGFLAFLWYLSLMLVFRQVSTGQTSSMLFIPMAIPYGAITVGTFTMSVRVIFKAIHDVRHPGETVVTEGDEE